MKKIIIKKRIDTIIFLVSVLALVSLAAPQRGRMIDSRDGKEYATVKIGGLVWMAENLNYETECSDCYDGESTNCEEYGRLYTWEDAMAACPEGWRLPTEKEFGILIGYYSDDEDVRLVSYVRREAKAVNMIKDGADDSGFAVLLAGQGGGGWYEGKGESAYFWSSSEGMGSVRILSVRYIYDHAYLNLASKNNGFSVRCLKNLLHKGTMTDSRDGKKYATTKIGTQVWMAENLNYETEYSLCFANEPTNCEKYGRLYTWEAAMAACPEGWHLPSKAEFGTLLEEVDRRRDALLKTGSDDYGFSAIVGVGSYSEWGSSYAVSYHSAFYWSSTESFGGQRANVIELANNPFWPYSAKSKFKGYSVRCLKDSP